MERHRRAKNFPPSFDAFSIPGTIEAVEGHPIKLSLKVEGNPRPQVRWQVGRKKVKPSGKYRVDQDDKGVCTLVVNKSHKNLEEGIWAIATNDLGEDCCMIEVKVNEKENSGEESDPPRRVVNFRRTEAIAEAQQFSPQRRRKNKIETENAPGKSGLVFGLQAKTKKTFSLSKSFELDEDKAGKKASRIDRSMVGEFNFFRETAIQKPSDLTKNIEEATRASPPHVTVPRLLHKPPPLPARTKTNDSGITKKVQDKRKPLQNRWKKGAFGSNSFIATSSEVEINEDEDDDDEEPVEAVRVTKRRRKKLPSVNASFESSLSSVNSVCLETNFDDCAPKLTEEKDSWQLETEFSSDFVPNEDDDKLEADVIAQVNKLPARQEDGDAWQMNGTEINRFCHDLLSNLQEINLTDYRQINNIQTQEETKSSPSISENSDSVSDFEMEAYCESPKRRHSLKIDSQIKSSPIPQPKSHEVEEAAQPSPPNQVCIQEIITGEQISVENSPSASNDEDDDDDDQEEEEEEEEEEEAEDEEEEEEVEEGERIERVESKETAEISRSEARGEVSTDEETGEDSGSVAADESRHSTSSGSELDAERQNESLENSIEKETSDDDASRENCNNDDENSQHVSDVNNNNDDDTNNNSSIGNSSAVKSSSIQFIDTDESEEEWPAPPSAEVLNSLISRPSLFPKKHDNRNNAYDNSSNNNNTTPRASFNNSTTAYKNNNNNNSPIAAHKLPLIQADFSIFKEQDKEKSNSSADFKLPAPKTIVHHSTNHTSPSSTRENRSPTYRDAILERAGTFGLTSSLIGLKSYMAGMAFKKVEFQVDQNDGNEYERESSYGNKTNAGETKSSLKFDPEIDRNYRNGGEFVRDERANLNSSPWQFEEPGKNHVEDRSERKSGEKKSVRFLEDDPKLSGNEIPKMRNVFKTFVQPEEHVCRPNHTTYTSSRWHDPTTNTRQFFSTNMPAQINGERQTMRLAFDERHRAKKEARPNEDDVTSPVTVHEYGELISFGQPLLGECQKTDTLDELAERTINEVVTNKCTVREAVKNILKNRKECSERVPDNLWSQSYDGARLPQNVERRLENYPLFLSDSERQTKRLGREMAAPNARFHPGVNNTNVKLPEPHFV